MTKRPKPVVDYKVFNYRVRIDTMRKFKVLAATSGRRFAEEVDAIVTFTHLMADLLAENNIPGTTPEAQKRLEDICRAYLHTGTNFDQETI